MLKYDDSSDFYEINVRNKSYVFFYDSKNYLILWQAVVSWSFYCDEMWFTEVYRNSVRVDGTLYKRTYVWAQYKQSKKKTVFWGS